LKVKRFMESRIRGWFPQDPVLKNNKIGNLTTNKCKTEADPKVYTRAGIANAIMMGCFLVIDDLISSFNRKIELTILSWSIFAASLLLVNVLVYRHYSKQAVPTGGI
jgi:hypothetical protein